MAGNSLGHTSAAICPDCGERIALKRNIRIGSEIICPHCDAVLEVVSTDPPELDWAYEDDFDDESEDDEG